MADNDTHGFSMRDVARIDRAVNAFEHDVLGLNAKRKRQVFPGDELQPYIVTQQRPTGQAAVYRSADFTAATPAAALNTCLAKRAEWSGSMWQTTGDEVEIGIDGMHDVVCTGQLVLVQSVGGHTSIN